MSAPSLTPAFVAAVLRRALQMKDYRTGTKHTVHAGTRVAVRRHPQDPGAAVVKCGPSRFATLPAISVPDYLERP